MEFKKGVRDGEATRFNFDIAYQEHIHKLIMLGSECKIYKNIELQFDCYAEVYNLLSSKIHITDDPISQCLNDSSNKLSEFNNVCNKYNIVYNLEVRCYMFSPKPFWYQSHNLPPEFSFALTTIRRSLDVFLQEIVKILTELNMIMVKDKDASDATEE